MSARLRTSGYMDSVFVPHRFKQRLEWAMEVLKDKEFDSIAVSGNSGTLFGGALSVALEKPIFLVRKTVRGSHAEFLTEGDVDRSAFIFVDDFICGGNTIKRVLEGMKIAFPTAKCMGACCYEDQVFRTREYLWDRFKLPEFAPEGTNDEPSTNVLTTAVSKLRSPLQSYYDSYCDWATPLVPSFVTASTETPIPDGSSPLVQSEGQGA